MIPVHMLFLCIAIYICITFAVFHVLLLYVHTAYQPDQDQCMFSFIFTLHNSAASSKAIQVMEVRG